MKILSMPIYSDMVVYKNLPEKKPVIINAKNFKEHGVFESSILLPLHTGTHIDYPLHIIENGKNSSDYSFSNVFYNGYVVDLTNVKVITEELVKKLSLDDISVLFFKTKNNTENKFDFEFTYLDKHAAKYISDSNLRFVGIDQLGIERDQPNHETHISLLEKDILIIEGLNLCDVEEGFYKFMFFTFHIQDVEAEPIIVCMD